LNKDIAAFLLVYTREAHPDSVFFVEKEGKRISEFVTPTKTLLARNETAKDCLANLNLSIPTVVDKEDNKVDEAYAGWPERLVVVGVDGTIAYYGGDGPSEFKIGELEEWLNEFRSHTRAIEKARQGIPVNRAIGHVTSSAREHQSIHSIDGEWSPFSKAVTLERFVSLPRIIVSRAASSSCETR
jgi:hypothetical protein